MSYWGKTFLVGLSAVLLVLGRVFSSGGNPAGAMGLTLAGAALIALGSFQGM